MSARVDVHGKESTRDGYARRSLDVTFPQLRQYLTAGMSVLEVGCGPGSITLDVAAVVDHGIVKGVDLQQTSVDQANATAGDRNVTNATFLVGDGLTLPFGPATFDLTYSHAFFDWVLDPVAALREQVRVTKPGGRICAMLTNNDTLMFYPSFASLRRFCDAMRLLADPAHPETYHDRFVGRRVVEILRKGGLDQIDIKPMEPRLWHAGAGNELPTSLRGIRYFLSDSRSDAQRFRERLLQCGAVSELDVKRAQEEWEQWLQHPHAFHMQVNVFATAIVPT